MVEERYDNFRRMINPILIKIIKLELIKIVTDNNKFIGIGIRLAQN